MASNHQAAQSALAANMAAQLPAAWNYLDLANLEATMPDYVQAIQALTTHYGKASAALAARSYLLDRKAAGIAGKVAIRPAPPAPFAQVDKGVRWATKGLYSETPDIEATMTKVKGVAQRDVLDPGRNTLLDAIQADKKAKGWARVPEAGACSFCLLLATRGAVYREHSFTNANFKFSGPGAFKTHDNCHCSLDPIFGVYEPSADQRRIDALYKQAAASARGPKAVRAAFRQLVEAEQHPADLVSV